VEEWPQLRSLEVEEEVNWGELAHDLGPVRLPRLERLAVNYDSVTCSATFEVESAPGFLEDFTALRPSIPALRVVELRWCVCQHEACEVVGCDDPETVELLAELRAAWPGLELRRWRRRRDEWTQA
jgi:hypothetical protein